MNTKTLDVRQLAPAVRHPTILSQLDGLGPDQELELLVDHDPKPLYYQLLVEKPGQFVWEYRESGPDLWRVAVRRS